MKKIYILRHAKAAKASKKILDDHERILTKKGIETCSAIAGYLQQNKIKPDIILCSTSKRTKQTVELIFKPDFDNLKILYTSKLYLANAAQLFQQIKKVSENNKSLMIVGHNPAVQELCLRLIKEGARKTIKEIKDFFPPGAIATLKAEVDVWKDIGVKTAMLEKYIEPKELLK